MVEKLAEKVKEKERSEIQKVFEENANYFSKHNKHHSQYIKKLFNYFNTHFAGVTETFTKDDLDCGECQTTVIKLWSTIIYDLWEKKIV
tara:strand:+ start:995 stop:1261 length:267 start_codon:yes stop_codon:yes gene_type:complete